MAHKKQQVAAFRAVEKIVRWKRANGIFIVEFKKTDGTLRQMTCSYDPKHQNKKVCKEESNYITVWDVIAGGYKTLNYSTIKHLVFGKDVYEIVEEPQGE